MGAARIALSRVFPKLAKMPKEMSANRKITGGTKVWIRTGTSDRNVFEQIFCWNELKVEFQKKQVDWIIDAGANVGFSTVWFANHFPNSRVLAIEPDLGNFLALQKNIKRFEPRVVALNAAVWDADAELQLSSETFRDGREWSRQFVQTKTGSQFQTTMSVPGFTLDSIVSEYRIPQIGILKLDVEGAETVIFKAGGRWLSKTSLIIAELHRDSSFGDPTPYFYQALQGQFDVSIQGERFIASRSS